MRHPKVADVPHLARLYSQANRYTADEISSQSGLEVAWICEKGHNFSRKVGSVANGVGNPCTECRPYRKVVAGVNDIGTTHPFIAARYATDLNFASFAELSKGSKQKVWWRCAEGHEYDREVFVEICYEGPCPHCSGQRVTEGENDLETLHPELVAMWSHRNPPMRSFAPKSAAIVEWLCKDGHRFSRRVFHQTNGILALCPMCPKLVDPENSAASKPYLRSIWSSKNALGPEYYTLESHQEVFWLFDSCGHEAKTTVRYMQHRTGMCPECSYKSKSSQEDYLASLVSELTGEMPLRSQRILDGKEIDILLPTLRRGIEFNGERWHRNDKAEDAGFQDSRGYHLWKRARAQELNVDLVFVWSHDWRKHRDDVVAELEAWLSGDEPGRFLTRFSSLYDEAPHCGCAKFAQKAG